MVAEVGESRAGGEIASQERFHRVSSARSLLGKV